MGWALECQKLRGRIAKTARIWQGERRQNVQGGRGRRRLVEGIVDAFHVKLLGLACSALELLLVYVCIQSILISLIVKNLCGRHACAMHGHGDARTRTRTSVMM